MKNSRKTKRALIPSILAVIMCVAMLIGTTFAWFTDTASTSVNKVQAGTLDVALMMSTDGTNWTDAEGKTLSFQKANAAPKDEAVLWEPGCTYELPKIKIINNGNLALKYKVMFSAVNTDAANLKLANVLDVFMNGTKVGTLNDVLTESQTTQDNDGYAWGRLAAKGNSGDSTEVSIKLQMQEGATNEYKGLTIGGIAVTVLAKQDTVEYDSNDNEYDKGAKYPGYTAPISANTTKDLTVNAISESGATTATVASEQTIGTTADDTMAVTYPQGTVLAISDETSGATRVSATQSLEYVGASLSSEATSSITIDAATQAVAQYDLKLPVDKEENKKLITVNIQYATSLSNVKIYHSGELLTETPNKSGETAVYSPSSGIITLKLLHASPIDIVYDKSDLYIEGDTLTNAYALQNVPGVYDAATETLTIPEGIKSVSKYALYKNGETGAFGKTDADKERLSVKKLVLPSSLESIGNEAFYAATNLTEIVWPENCKIKQIGNGAFNYCESLTEVTIPDSVETMGVGVFANCKSLKKVSGLPTSVVENVPENMFAQCPLVVSENDWLKQIKTVGKNAFSNAFASDQALDLSSVTSIAENGFKTSRLAEVILPSTLTSVGIDAFRDCSFLKKLTLPTGNTTYGADAFRNCNALEVLNIAEGSTSFDKSPVSKTNIKEVSLPSTLRTVGDGAFQSWTSLEKVTLAAADTTYGTNVFRGCAALKEVVIPDGCTTIGNAMFQNCTSLTTISFPTSLTTIKEDAFRGDTCLSGNVFIPGTVTTIGSNAFRDITGIHCAAETQPSGWSGWNNKLNTVTWGEQS